MGWEDYDRANEIATWRSSIKRMFQSKDLEGLLELKNGPESLEDEVIEFLESCIKQLEEEKEMEK